LRNILRAHKPYKQGFPEPITAFLATPACVREATGQRLGYRLGAERYSVEDYLTHISEAGFRRLVWHEHQGDEQLVEQVSATSKYLHCPLLLLVQAKHAA